MRGPKPYPVRIRGKTYPSAKAAAKALGVAESTVHCAISRGNPDKIGTGCKRPGNGGHRAKPLTIGGVTYPSRKAASLALGRHPRYISRILNCGNETQRQDLLRQFMELHTKKGLA